MMDVVDIVEAFKEKRWREELARRTDVHRVVVVVPGTAQEEHNSPGEAIL
jgi:hypothetical protein